MTKYNEELVDRAHVALDTKSTQVHDAINSVDKTKPSEVVVFSEGDNWDIDIAYCLIYAGYNVTYLGNSLWTVQGNKKDDLTEAFFFNTLVDDYSY